VTIASRTAARCGFVLDTVNTNDTTTTTTSLASKPRRSFAAATWFLGRPGRMYAERYARPTRR
jgi:hypothetical protein